MEVSAMFGIQPTAPSPSSWEVDVPEDCPLNTTTKEISPAGTEEDILVRRWHLKICMGWIDGV